MLCDFLLTFYLFKYVFKIMNVVIEYTQSIIITVSNENEQDANGE